MKITRNKLIKYSIYVGWLELLSFVAYAWWLIVVFHFDLNALIVWIWQGLLLALVVAYPFAKAVTWMVNLAERRFPG